MNLFVIKHFVKLLKKNGYRVCRTRADKYYDINSKKINEWEFYGKGVRGFILDYSPYGNLFVECNEFFDKLWKCPIKTSIETVNHEDLLEDLKFLGTEEGCNYSKYWGYTEDNFGKFKTKDSLWI